MKYLKLLTTCIFVFLFVVAYSQDTTKTKKELRKEKKEAKKNEPPHKGSFYITPLPAIGQNPAWGFMYGVAVGTSWYMGDPATTNISSLTAGIIFTTKSQVLFTAKGTAYSEENNWKYDIDWRLLKTSQPTYGLGTGPLSAQLASNGFEIDDGVFSAEIDEEQLMNYNFIRFHQTVSKRFGDNIYLGIGYNYDKFKDVEDNLLDLEADPPVVTNYYAYNHKYGFDQSESTLSGISLNATYDTRDNVNSAYSGRYALVSFNINPEFLGSDKSSTTLWLEYRDYFDLTKDHKNMLSVWWFGNFNTSGTLPYMNLPALGYDQMSNSGRGYAQGRFRGENLMYTEAEYRRMVLGIKKNPDFLSVAIFANATTASGKDSDIDFLQYIDPAIGVGLRFMVEKQSRTTIAVDYAIGKYGAKGLYIQLNQAF